MGRYHRVPWLSAISSIQGVNKTSFLNGWQLVAAIVVKYHHFGIRFVQTDPILSIPISNFLKMADLKRESTEICEYYDFVFVEL